MAYDGSLDSTHPAAAPPATHPLDSQAARIAADGRKIKTVGGATAAGVVAAGAIESHLSSARNARKAERTAFRFQKKANSVARRRIRKLKVAQKAQQKVPIAKAEDATKRVEAASKKVDRATQTAGRAAQNAAQATKNAKDAEKNAGRVSQFFGDAKRFFGGVANFVAKSPIGKAVTWAAETPIGLFVRKWAAKTFVVTDIATAAWQGGGNLGERIGIGKRGGQALMVGAAALGVIAIVLLGPEAIAAATAIAVPTMLAASALSTLAVLGKDAWRNRTQLGAVFKNAIDHPMGALKYLGNAIDRGTSFEPLTKGYDEGWNTLAPSIGGSAKSATQSPPRASAKPTQVQSAASTASPARSAPAVAAKAATPASSAINAAPSAQRKPAGAKPSGDAAHGSGAAKDHSTNSDHRDPQQPDRRHHQQHEHGRRPDSAKIKEGHRRPNYSAIPQPTMPLAPIAYVDLAGSANGNTLAGVDHPDLPKARTTPTTSPKLSQQ